jgi:hypothetical protein
MLQQLLKDKLAGTSGTRRVAGGMPLVLSEEQESCLKNVKKLLIKSVKLHYVLANAVVCVFTDASDFGWSVVVTQVVEWNYGLKVEEQDHQALIFLSGCFRGSELNWTVTEKVAFPIIMALEKADYILHREGGFRLYCDHLNLISIFSPDKSTTKRTSVGRLHRWSMKLMSFQYEAYHIAGVENVWADLVGEARRDSKHKKINKSSNLCC